jgi:hypothetical protein
MSGSAAKRTAHQHRHIPHTDRLTLSARHTHKIVAMNHWGFEDEHRATYALLISTMNMMLLAIVLGALKQWKHGDHAQTDDAQIFEQKPVCDQNMQKTYPTRVRTVSEKCPISGRRLSNKCQKSVQQVSEHSPARVRKVSNECRKVSKTCQTHVNKCPTSVKTRVQQVPNKCPKSVQQVS